MPGDTFQRRECNSLSHKQYEKLEATGLCHTESVLMAKANKNKMKDTTPSSLISKQKFAHQFLCFFKNMAYLAVTPSPHVDAPYMRGKIHLLLVYLSPLWISKFFSYCTSLRSFIAISTTVLCIFINFVASALLHNLDWTPESREIVNKIDHVGIFVMIAGSCTTIPVLLFHGKQAFLCILIQWTAVLMGIYVSFKGSFSKDTVCNKANHSRAKAYVSTGLLYVMFLPSMIRVLQIHECILLFCLAAFYILGAFFYAKKKPNPFPKVFGFHELFHLCCFLSAVCTFALNWSVLDRVAREST